jgi:tetratricopeptide (TPR) repeat protein
MLNLSRWISQWARRSRHLSGSPGEAAGALELADDATLPRMAMLDGLETAVPATPPAWLSTHSRRLGRYHVGPLLGSGGMGEVFEAWDALLRRPVALKILQSSHPGHLLRFIQEAQLQARVDHPNVCRVYDAEVVDGTPLIAMRLVRGTTLAEAAERLSRDEIVSILRKVAEAMHAAHRLQLIHRDLKPSNILLERNEWGHWVPYLTDFGLAKDLAGAGLTRTHAVMGTPAYMAPEQMRGEVTRIGPATDVYALGATLRDALAGCPPSLFEDLQPIEGTRKDAEPRTREIPRDLSVILGKCLEERTEDRYPNAAELAEDLRRFQDGEILHARPVGWVGTLVRLGRSHPRLTLSSAGALAAILGLAAWNVGISFQARRRESSAQGFIAHAKDMEYLLRIERMRPPHDLRPAFLQIRTQLEETKSQMLAMGTLSQGPGHYALGRGYLSLRKHEDALREFETAWADGYRVPEMAYSIGKAHCEVYSDHRWEALAMGGTAVQSLKQKHLEAARHYFALAGGQSLEPMALGKAQLALLEGDNERAIAMAREAFTIQPWNAEGKRLEAAAWYQKGYAFQYNGRMKDAERCYQESTALSRITLDLARSDEVAMSQYHAQRMEWALKKLEDRTLTLEECDELIAISDNLLTLDPDNPDSICAKLNALNNRASHLGQSGGDPRPDCRKGLELAKKSEQIPDPRHQIGVGLMRILHQEAEYEYLHGLDPRPAVTEALRKAPPGDDRCETITIVALWELEHGLDPSNALEQLEAAARISMQVSEFAYHHYYLGNALRLRGIWAAQTGRDPRPLFSRAIAEQETALRMNPDELWCWIELARTRISWVRYSPDKGEDLLPIAEQAIADGEKAVGLSPLSPFPLRALADSHLLRAQLKLERHQDPSKDVAKGLKAIKSAIVMNGDRWFFHQIEARLHLIEGESDLRSNKDPLPAITQAEQAFRRGIALNPWNADLWTVKALSELLRKSALPTQRLLEKTDSETVLSPLHRALAINPNHREALKLLAQLVPLHGIQGVND